MNLNTKHAGKLFILSGPSGAGKGTICKELLAQTDLQLSVSMTTRAPREGEIHGVHYYFVDEEEFLDRISKDGFLEHAILEIDIQGALKVKENYPDGVFIFILPPSMAELRKRLTGRGTETAEAIEMRLGETLKELSFIEKYDYCVVNGELDEAVSRVKSIVIAEHSKVTITAEELVKRYKEEE